MTIACVGKLGLTVGEILLCATKRSQCIPKVRVGMVFILNSSSWLTIADSQCKNPEIRVIVKLSGTPVKVGR